MISVVIVDDHAIVRQGLKRILSESGKITLIGEAGSYPELVALIKNGTLPDVLVLDISLPGLSGFEALSQIKDDWPTLPVLILSVHPEEQYALRSLKSGASGYLSKEAAPEQLVEAIETIYKKKRYITPAVADLLTENLNADPMDVTPHHQLSNREFQVLLLIGKGMPLTEIGKKFNVSVKTISTYRLRILEKMKLKTNADLVQYIIKNKLDSLD